jgi:gliding motility-associated-like protein
MKCRLRKLFLFFVIIIIAVELNAQLYSTAGKEFWVSFPEVSNVLNFVATPYVYLTSEKSCTGSIQNKSGSFNLNFTIKAGEQIKIALPIDLFYVNNFEVIELKGAYIRASENIQVFLSAGTGIHLEIATAIPIESLGSDYLIMTYAYGGLNVARSSSHFMLLGVEDNTVVDIIPSNSSNQGSSVNPFTVILNKGETYLFTSDRDLDLTNTNIHTRDCKKLVVYTGAKNTGVPTACNNHTSQLGLFEQSAPLNTLGTAFLITRSPIVEKEYIKVLATQDNTKLYINGILVSVLNKGSYYENYLIDPSFIKSNKPVIVAYFGISFCGLNLPANVQPYGGAFMILETPLEQSITSAAIIIQHETSVYKNQFLQIHIKSKDKTYTILDGKNISDAFKIFPSNPEYSYAQIKLDTGAHVLQNIKGFTADITSMAENRVGASYGYSAGSLLNKSNQYASVNGNSSNLQKEFLFCPMQAVNFEAVRQDTVFSKVYWHFDDGSIDSGNVVNKTFKDTGCHQVQMISYYSGSSGNCLLGNGATDTTFLKVCVVNSLPLSIGNDTGFCRNRPLTLQSNINPDGFSYLWSTGATSSAISVTETGNYWLELKNGNCAIRDSVQVTVVDKPVLSIQGDKLLCSGDSILLQNSVNSPTVNYTWNNGKKGYSQWINKPGLYSLSGIDRGCYAETSINIGELSCPEIYVPTGFTPDGDGRNDIIRPICAGIDLVYFRVYNRYGQMIFETREDGKGWNGKLNGIQQSMATYVYVVEGRDKSGRQHIRKGTFVLIR